MSSPRMRAVVGACLALALPAASGSAQDPDSNLVDLSWISGVPFTTSCSPASQPRVEKGVALVHLGEWEVAGDVFREVRTQDSSCVMAAWGLAMALRGNPFAEELSESTLQEAWTILSDTSGWKGITPRERDYLEAVKAYFRDFDRLDPHSRSLTYEVKMRELAQRYRDDLEATVFYGQAAASAVVRDTTLERRAAVGAMLDSLFTTYPDHPGTAHYVIHVYDHPTLAHLGLEAARRFASAPGRNTPHARHIPSHIYARLGMWDEVIEANDRAVEFGDGDLLHAMDYLIYAYLQQGRDDEARNVYKAASRRAAQVSSELHFESAKYAVFTIPARYALERHDWVRATRLPLKEYHAFPPGDALTRFARALGAARTGVLEATRREFDEILAIERSVSSGRDVWRRYIEAHRLIVSAWVALAEGDTANALLLAAEAADREDSIPIRSSHIPEVLPARELLGDLLTELGRYEDAGAAYEAVLHRAPNRARSLFGAAWTAQLAGNHDAAADWFKRYLTLTERGDGDRPELAVAEAYVQGYARRH